MGRLTISRILRDDVGFRKASGGVDGIKKFSRHVRRDEQNEIRKNHLEHRRIPHFLNPLRPIAT